MNASNEDKTETTNWKFHDSYAGIVAETHARPAQPIHDKTEILHVALRCKDEIANSFFERLNSKVLQSGPRHLTGKIGSSRVKLERHNEFLSCTIFQENGKSAGSSELMSVLADNFPVAETEILVLLKLNIVASIPLMLKIIPPEHRIYGGLIRDRMEVRSNFMPDDDGAIQFVLYGKQVTPDEQGRRIQRLIEMETYRTMSLLGLQVARRVGEELSDLEDQLELLTQKLRRSRESDEQDDTVLFNALSEQCNRLLSETRYRFAASRAYNALFQQRIESLEEVKVGDVQTMSGFLRSRMAPAMATIESTAKRQETLNDDLSRAITLLRTRIELDLNKGNQNLLKSMDRRHDQQLKISQTVEGLSIIAISYYAVGLVSYLLKAIASQPWVTMSDKLMTAIAVPFVCIIVFFSLRRVRRAWHEKEES